MSVINLTTEDKDRVNQCFESLNNHEELWTNHEALGNGVLVSDNPGKTIWLRSKSGPWRLQDIKEVSMLRAILSKYQKLLMPEIQEEVSHRFGRVYVHRLKPGQLIGRHRDYNDQPYMSYLTRFQLYGNIAEGNTIEMVPAVQENSFLHFNHNEMHEYKNYSKDNLYFIVYDLIDKQKMTNYFNNAFNSN